jgi:hypothetical protein
MRKSCLVLAGFIVVLAPLCNSIAESDTPEIILENGFYYVVQPNGEKVAIVSEEEPNALNKAKLSPDRQYVVYTTANGLGFESEGRDLFYSKTDGTEQTFLHKFETHIDDWIWMTKGKRKFLIVIGKECMTGSGVWVLDFNKKQLLLSFPGDSVEKIENSECYKIIGGRKGSEICINQLIHIKAQDIPETQVFINWVGNEVFLSTKRDPALSCKDILECFVPIYDILPPDEKTLYRTIRERLTTYNAWFTKETTSLVRGTIVFSIDSMNGRFDLRKKRVEYLDIGGELSLKAFRSPRGKYLGILKTEHTGIKKLIILSKKPDASWGNVLTKEFSVDAAVSNLEWSKADETKIYYSLKEGTVTKDSCVIDLTKTQKK